MDITFEHNNTAFVWHLEKAAENEHKHGVDFAEAATVFDDPFLCIVAADRNGQAREKAIGFSVRGRLLAVVHLEFEGEHIRLISAWTATETEEALYDQ